MSYFQQFPKILYDMKGDGTKKLVPDIFRRIKARDKIKNNLTLLDKYDVESGDTPESVAYKVYGNTEYFWVVCMVNNIVNRFNVIANINITAEILVLYVRARKVYVLV